MYQGRCLSCDPFPSGHGPAAAVTAAPAVYQAQREEELPHRRLSNGSGRSRNTNPSPPTAMVTTADATTKIPASSRFKSDRSLDAERERHEAYHESEENMNRGKTFGRIHSLDPRLLRDQQHYQQNEHHHHQNEHRPLQATRINEDNNYYDARGRGIEDNAPLPSTMLPPPRVATGRPKTNASGVPKTLEVIRRGPPRSGNSSIGGNGYSNGSISSNNFGDDQSVVSAITMDIHLFQSFGNGDDSLEDEINAIDDHPPPTSYNRRPGPERISSRNYSNRNHKSNTSTSNLYERRHSTGGDVNSDRRHIRRSFNNTSHDSRNRNSNTFAPPATARNLSPTDDYENGARADTHFRPPTAATAVVEARSHIRSRSSHDNLDYYRDSAVPYKTGRNNTNSKNRMSNREADFLPDETGNKRIKNHTTHAHTRRLLDSPETNRNRRNRSNSDPDILSNEVGPRGSSAPEMINNDDDDDFPSFIMDENDFNDDRGFNGKRLQQEQYRELESNDRQNGITGLKDGDTTVPQATVTPASSASSSAPLNDVDDSRKLKKRSSSSKMVIEERDIADVPGILRCLNLEECNPDIRERALCKLADIMQSTSRNYYAADRERHIREFILENDVIEAVTKSMWADMEIVEVQEAAMNVLVFIAASMEMAYAEVGNDCEQLNSNGNSNLLSENEAVCDSILFTMQNHPAIHGIQLKGSLIFASLAASSSDDNNVGTNADGSLSGAMTMVLNAMSNHGDSRPIRKAGLQALHHQCLLSAYAEDNKRNFVESKLGNGMPAVDLVIYAMEELQKDLVAMEWACQLCWCLTSNEDSLKQIEHVSLHEGTMTICQHYMTNPIGVGLVEASIGTIANLAYLERKRNEMINTGAVELVLDGLRYHGDVFGISYEAAFALENFSLPPYLPGVSSMLLKSEAIPLLVRGLKTFLEYPEYVIQGLRALIGIGARCDEARGRIGSPEIISLVHECSRKHRNADVLEICSIFVATLAMGETASVSNFMIEHGAVDLLIFAMECSPNEKVQDAACLAFRNLSSHIEKLEEFLKDGKTSKLIVNAMDAHVNSVSIQTNGCCVFWNLLSKADEKQFDFDPKIVTTVTKAMQSHIESGELLELACGALWVAVDRFNDQKVHVGTEAIDVVACAMVMHPGTTSTLEKACGLLSNLSSEESLAKSIAKAQGVSIVSEAMCNNASSIALLESGCLTLKNIILVCPSYAQDGTVAISTLVMAMKENVGATSFIKEACDIIWILASENENARSKVLALDGISILMKCLEQNNNHPEVETSALGAFNQLAKVNSQKTL